MQSGPIVLVRATVMLACMIVVPLVAIFWKHWPEAIDLARDGQWAELADMGMKIVTQSGPQPSTAHPTSQEAPSFAPAASATPTVMASDPAAAAPTSPLAATASAPPQMLPTMAESTLAAAPVMAPPSPVVAPVGYTAPVNPAAPAALAGSPIPEPVEKAAPVAENLAQASPLPSPGPGNDLPGPQQNPFRDMEQRLRMLGATYYLLESWGNAGNLYRFHVKMALAGNPSYNRHFEATDADPITAMRHVLSEVEAWRNGQQL